MDTQTLYAPVQGNARAIKGEWVGFNIGLLKDIVNLWQASSVPIPEPMPEPAVAKAPPIMEESFRMPDIGMEESKETQDFTEPEPVFLEEPIPIPEPVSPEPVSPIEPANIPKPAVEETSPLPNMADPGHVMTPEEIASLLANM